MDSLHKLLNVLVPLFALVFVPLFLPPYLIYNLFKYLTKSSKRPKDLAGKIVLITGASSGIGEHLAYEYAKRGARLALAARRDDRLRRVAAKAGQLGSPDCVAIIADVADIEHCRRLVDQTVSHFGQLDYLVNNAGISEICLFEDSSNEVSTSRSIMDINFWGSVYCTQFAVPHLRKSQGNIVVISSSASWCSSPRMSYYNASKAAQVSFFETLKSEFGSEIGVTIVTPGIIDSEMTGKQFWSKSKLKGIPSASTESCAKAIVESACEGDTYLTVPSWYGVGFWLKVFFPELLLNYFHFTLVRRPWTSNKDS